MTKVARILLSVIVVAIVWPVRISVAQAIPITKGSYEFESRKSARSATGIEHYRTRIIGLDKGPEGLPRSEKVSLCDLDPQGCGAITEPHNNRVVGAMSANNTRVQKNRSAGEAGEFSEPTALLLLIIGVIGLSRLRGRPVD